jgi:phosphoglycolate phosphatase
MFIHRVTEHRHLGEPYMGKHVHLAKYEVYLFDLDGTLLDTSGDIAYAINVVREGHGLSTLSQAEVEAGVGHGATALLLHCLPLTMHHKIDELREVFIQAYASHLCVCTQPYPYADAMLKSLKMDTQKKRVLVTNKPRRFAIPLLDQVGWSDLFDLCLFGDSLSERKPSSLPIDYALNQLSLEVGQALFIGDTDVDAQAAMKAGVDLAIVSHGRVAQAVLNGRYGSSASVIELDQLIYKGKGKEVRQNGFK